MSPALPRVRDFVSHLKSHQQFAVDIFSPDRDPRPFVPAHVIKDYLTQECTKHLLDDLCRTHTNYEAVRNRYGAVFSILNWIGKGTLILFFTEHLHLSDAYLPFRTKETWPLAGCDFFDEFYKAQWHFCAMRLHKDLLHESTVHPEHIIPIISSEPLKKGPDSSTFKIDLPSGYGPTVSLANSSKETRDTFVLKTCPIKHSELHRNEVKAYRALGEQPDTSQNLAFFHGSWKQGDTYFMLLEYVEGGTLEKYIEKTRPPSKTHDMITLWENLSGLCKILCCLHSIRTIDGNMQGIHHDIKPANILVSKALSTNVYDVEFKLADLGLVNFSSPSTNGVALFNRDIGGTKTYTAPESCRGDDNFLERVQYTANPAKDIWSLGCVYSEVAVWTVNDTDGLRAFRNARTIATNNTYLQVTGYSGGFHDGQKVLQAVLDMHRNIRHESRRNDSVIHGILGIIDEMLEEEKHRISAFSLYRKILRVLGDAKASSKLVNGNGSGAWPEAFRTADDPFLNDRVEPPEKPPIALDSLGLRLQNTSEPESTSPGRIQTSSKEPSARSTGPKPWSNPSNSGPPQNRSGSSSPRHVRPSHRVSFPGLEDKNENCAPRTKRYSVQSKPSSKESHPHMTIHELANWRERRGSINSLKGFKCLQGLDGRDQIFLIDDSSSMKKHWKLLLKAFKALSYLVKNNDPDGIEMFCANTASVRGYKSKDSSDLFERLKTVTPEGQCDMGEALSEILNRFFQREGKREKVKRLLYKKKGTAMIYVLTDGVWEDGPTALKRVKEPIKKLAERISKENVRNKGLIGIEFIQFGDDEEGASRLEDLDDWLKEEGLDIVDTEHIEGNVYKMLLGSIKESWDDLAPDSTSGQGSTRYGEDEE
ncbi:hypothetical protein BS50DRAFT_553398 [Corynespora cassiicola Philippines]|uniref:non-specific serine/threonine protein kinase n=1 Tax=Corynespora cassiicola Philippines TaxID=1448308 RepID=A0A2T2NPS8_CORCC|nr:hypothetical protein BS50DRAFT_553398 [Corynespora cassiicola Philippines]